MCTVFLFLAQHSVFCFSWSVSMKTVSVRSDFTVKIYFSEEGGAGLVGWESLTERLLCFVF